MSHEPEPEGFFSGLHYSDIDAEVQARDLSDELCAEQGERDKAERRLKSACDLLRELKVWLDDADHQLSRTYWATRIAKRLERLA